jgi:2-polyprenyl-6-methoxyphenol hydroxylase-like FAD-dependent oxidoreductase
VRSRLREAFAGWSPSLLAVLAELDGFASWPLYSVAAHQDWARCPGLTLLGDAAHVMPPFSGEGVNMALLDAVQLVEQLTDPRHRCVDEAVAAYEHVMLDRMADAVTSANADGDTLLTPHGPAPLLARLAA